MKNKDSVIKVLVIGPNFFHYTEHVSEHFSRRGYSTKYYLTTTGSFEKLIAMLSTIKCSKLSDKLRSYQVSDAIRRNDDKIISMYKSFKPSHILVIKGSYLSNESIHRVSQDSEVSLWIMDSFKLFPHLLPNAKSVKHCYVFEASDIETFSGQGIKMSFLPMGYDDSIYKPLNFSQKDIDISFVGSMYPKRREILFRLVQDFPDLRMQFYGSIVSRYHPIAYRQFKERYSSWFTNVSIEHEEINRLFNRSKICLNISHDQSHDGWNPRTVEILGAGAFQIATENKAIRDNFDGCVETFQSYDELREKIAHYMNHPEEREEIARRGHLAVKGRHSFNNRIDTICRDWGLFQ